MPIDPVEILSQLVETPSVNPMGGEPNGPHYGTQRLTERLEKTFRTLGLAVERQPVAGGEHNVIARLDGDPRPEHGGPFVLLGAHQDTVPVEGMKIEPFKAVIRGSRLYGRGACDVKGGMAAMLAALARVAQLPATQRPTVAMVCTVNEEFGFGGVRALVRAWKQGGSGLLTRRPDAAIIAEPTGLDVVVAHKGVVRWRCHARGRAAHSSRPELGENAIYRMARALVAVERYQNQVAGMLASHPLCGLSTISVGTIRGGASVNIVPDHAVIEIDRRLPPGETPESARQHLIEYLAGQQLGFTPEYEAPYMQGPPLSDEHNRELTDRLVAVTTEVAGACRRVGVAYATDAAFVAEAGVPSVVFGPGSIEQAHTDSEWIDLEQLKQGAEIYYRLLRSWP
jgi:acetylornithine deacetylase